MNFWDAHSLLLGVGFLISIALFPRITMLVATSVIVGPLAWLGWAIFPRITVAVFAYQLYWDTNPVLVIIAGILAANPLLQSKREKREVPQSIGEVVNASFSQKFDLAMGALSWYGWFLIMRGLYKMTGLSKLVDHFRWRKFMASDIDYTL